MLIGQTATKAARAQINRRHHVHQRERRQSVPSNAPSESNLTSSIMNASNGTVPPGSWFIDPKSPWRSAWDVLISFCIMYSVVVLPYKVGFDTTLSYTEERFEDTLDLLFGFDILSNFFLAYTEMGTSKLVLDHRKIAVRYLRGWFFVDAFSTFPFWAVSSGASSSLVVLRVFRLARLMKLLRLLRLKRIAKMLTEFQEKFDLNPAMLRLLSLLFRIVYMLHMLACVWFYIVCLQPGPTTFVDVYTSSPANLETGLSLRHEPRQVAYLVCMYFVTVAAFGVGFGDYLPTTPTEQIVVVFVFFFGSVAVGLIIGSLSSASGQSPCRGIFMRK